MGGTRRMRKRIDEFLIGYKGKGQDKGESKRRVKKDPGRMEAIVRRYEPTQGKSLIDFLNDVKSDFRRARGERQREPRLEPPRPDMSKSSSKRRGWNGGITVAELLAGEDKSWWLMEPNNFSQSVSGYLMEVRYDGRIGKAVALIYNPDDGRLYRWVDSTDHRPYFLVELSPEELRRSGVDIDRHESFVMYDVMSKFHPIMRKWIKVTRVVVSDPLAVRSLRKKLESRGIRFWEADIKYHHNYIYDHLLIPGMTYTASKGWKKQEWKADHYVVEKIFADESNEIKEMAREWVPILEHPPPDIPRLAIDIEVYTPQEGRIPDPNTADLPVISVGMADNRGMKKVLVYASYGQRFTGETDLPDDVDVEIFDNEVDMLLEAFRIMEQYPVILTFNGDNFDLPYLYNRLQALGLSKREIPIEVHQDYITFRHMIHIDLYKFFDIRALQVYAFGGKYREKNLDAIASALLGMAKEELEGTVSEVSLETLIKYNARDAELTVKLTTFANNLVWNLIILLMRISKMGIEDVTRTQVSGWIKGLMNWEHRRRKWLIPSREEIKKVGGKVGSKAIIEDKKYMGALVLEPPQGIFFNVLVVDFASLYPSILKNWNLSYETVDNKCEGDNRDIVVENEYGKPIFKHTVCTDIQGITSQIIGMIRDFRVKLYKKKAKQKDLPDVERIWYDTVQSALKVFINASYGVFGNESFNLYSPALAESVTAIGRQVLRSTLRKARSMDLVILYGDTDSLFLWDPPRDKLEELISYVKQEHGLDLEVDKVFSIALFSGLKKNYIGVTGDGKVIIKGMVGKKSNAPEFLKKEFNNALEILSRLRDPDKVEDILEALRDHITGVYNKLKRRHYTLDELAINVMLSKDLKEYTKNTPQHVKAAKMLQRYGVQVTRGYIVSFVKTRDKLGVKPVRLAKLSEVDTNKYMEYLRTAFEQMLLASGVRWEEFTGSSTRTLESILSRG
ncbi:MAG: DNA-directed DNA polymerase I [Desulfurococcales archaeon]|nr:DNA-directed DNA polymerase I [Desulfurococcales archaeon]